MKKYLTLIDRDETATTGKEFVYAQFKLKNGRMTDKRLIKKFLELELINPLTEELYTKKDFKQQYIWDVLESEFFYKIENKKRKISTYK